MIKTAFIINNDAGLTSEMQSKIISLISQYQSNVDFVRWDGLRMNARHSGLVHMMRFRKGEKFFVQSDGFDAQKVSNAITELFKEFDVSRIEY